MKKWEPTAKALELLKKQEQPVDSKHSIPSREIKSPGKIKFYTAKQVMEKVQCSKDFVYRAIHSGNLPATKFGRALYRISEKDLETWIAKMKFKPEK